MERGQIDAPSMKKKRVLELQQRYSAPMPPEIYKPLRDWMRQTSGSKRSIMVLADDGGKIDPLGWDINRVKKGVNVSRLRKLLVAMVEQMMGVES